MHRCANRFAAGGELEDADGCSVLGEGGPPDVENVVESFEFDRPVDTEVRARTFGECLVERNIDSHCALFDGGIDARDMAGDKAITGVNRSRLIDLNVLRL